jgi:hypothetical protein
MAYLNLGDFCQRIYPLTWTETLRERTFFSGNRLKTDEITLVPTRLSTSSIVY